MVDWSPVICYARKQSCNSEIKQCSLTKLCDNISMKIRYKSLDRLSNQIPNSKGVKHGCIFAPLSFYFHINLFTSCYWKRISFLKISWKANIFSGRDNATIILIALVGLRRFEGLHFIPWQGKCNSKLLLRDHQAISINGKLMEIKLNRLSSLYILGSFFMLHAPGAYKHN